MLCRSVCYLRLKKDYRMVTLDKRVDLLRIIANPMRIKILEDLTHGVKCVGDSEDSLDISQPNVSRHLTSFGPTELSIFLLTAYSSATCLKNPLSLISSKY